MTIENLPTRAELNAKILYNPSTGEFNRVRIFSKGTKKRILGSAVIERDDGKKRVYALGQMYTASKLAWYMETGEMPEGTIMFKNGDVRDIRISNLRLSNHVTKGILFETKIKNSLGLFNSARDLGHAVLVENFPDYAVFRDGRVMSLRRGIFLTADDNTTRRYKGFNLVKGKSSTSLMLHRILATAFLPNPDNLPMVLHADDNANNNNLNNLRWGTAQDNVNDREKHKANRKEMI